MKYSIFQKSAGQLSKTFQRTQAINEWSWVAGPLKFYLCMYLSVTHLHSLDQSVKCQLALKTLKDFF